MSYKVIKFGGSNLRKTIDFRRCAEIVVNYDAPCIIVVSAFFKVTDKLKQAAIEASDSGNFPEPLLLDLYSTCEEQINANIDDPRIIEHTRDELRRLLDKLANLYKGVYAIGELPPAINDTILSFGERISALILSAVIRSRGLKTSLALPENFGLITDGEFGSASIKLKESSKAVINYFSGKQYYVVPGFYGVSAEGKINLLGRGGSDYSAAALANMVEADSLDIWKDVCGFQTCDPKIVKDPKTINQLSYNEAAELSYFGAKILHPRTVEPLIPKGIPVRIFNVKQPSAGPGTLISPDTGADLPGPKSITFSRNFSVLKLKGPGVGSKPGVLAKVAGIMDIAGVNISSVFTSQTAICFLLQKSDLRIARKAIKVNAPALINEVEAISDIALVALVGEGITTKQGIAAKAFQAVAAENINVEIIAAGASTAAVYFVVKESDCNRAVIATHNFFFSEGGNLDSRPLSENTSIIL